MDNSLDEKAFDTILDQASTTIQPVTQQMVQLLKRKVIAWRHRMKFSEELKESSMMIQLAPHDPTGYLCVGGYYAEKGYQHEAIKVFD